jgi:hypothetical protein
MLFSALSLKCVRKHSLRDETHASVLHIVTWWSVTIDALWINDSIYCTLWYSAWLHFTVHYYTHTTVQSRLASLPLFGSGFQPGRSPSSAFPNRPRPQLPASKSNSSQWLNRSGPLTNNSKTKSKSTLLYDWPFTAIQFVLERSPSRIKTRDFC